MINFYIEDFTRVVMTTSVRFYLSYEYNDPFKWDLKAYKINIDSARKRIIDTDVVNDVTSTRYSVITRGHTIFCDVTLCIE